MAASACGGGDGSPRVIEITPEPTPLPRDYEPPALPSACPDGWQTLNRPDLFVSLCYPPGWSEEGTTQTPGVTSDRALFLLPPESEAIVHSALSGAVPDPAAAGNVTRVGLTVLAAKSGPPQQALDCLNFGLTVRIGGAGGTVCGGGRSETITYLLPLQPSLDSQLIVFHVEPDDSAKYRKVLLQIRDTVHVLRATPAAPNS